MSGRIPFPSVGTTKGRFSLHTARSWVPYVSSESMPQDSGIVSDAWYIPTLRPNAHPPAAHRRSMVHGDLEDALLFVSGGELDPWAHCLTVKGAIAFQKMLRLHQKHQSRRLYTIHCSCGSSLTSLAESLTKYKRGWDEIVRPMSG